MPKVGGKDMDECMEICMSDEQTKKEYPDTDKRQEVCAGACSEKFQNRTIAELIKIYKNKQLNK